MLQCAPFAFLVSLPTHNPFFCLFVCFCLSFAGKKLSNL